MQDLENGFSVRVDAWGKLDMLWVPFKSGGKEAVEEDTAMRNHVVGLKRAVCKKVTIMSTAVGNEVVDGYSRHYSLFSTSAHAMFSLLLENRNIEEY